MDTPCARGAGIALGHWYASLCIYERPNRAIFPELIAGAEHPAATPDSDADGGVVGSSMSTLVRPSPPHPYLLLSSHQRSRDTLSSVMRREISRTRWFMVILTLTWGVALAWAAAIILGFPGASRKDHALPPPPPVGVPSGLLTGITAGASPTLAPRVRQPSDSDLFNVLLPAGAVPSGLRHDLTFPLPNEEVARFFPDPAAAQRAMMAAGRVEGVGVDYRVPGRASASTRALVISSSAARYTSVDGAKGVLQNPTMELVIHRFGLNTAEITLARVGEESRAFRGYRDIDGPNRAAYLLIFRKANVIGAVVVVMTDHNDDIGELVSLLAQKQYGLMP